MSNDLSNLMYHRVQGLRTTLEIGLDELGDDQVADAILIEWKGMTLLILPTVCDDMIVHEVKAYKHGRLVTESTITLREDD